MCARAGEVQIVIARMFIFRTEVSQLGQVVTQPVRGAFHQVIPLAPRERREIGLELDVRFKVGDTQTRQTAEDVLTRFVSNTAPILFTILAHVTYGNDPDHGIFSLWRHGRVQPRRSVDVQTGIGRQAQVLNDTFEILAVVVREEEHVRGQRFVLPIQTPEETDD